MATAKQWRESSTGPDWTDLRAMMIAIGGLHTAAVELTVSPLGTGSTGCVKIEAAAHFDLLPGSSLPESVLVNVEWPSQKAKSLCEAAYNLLWQLDYQISKVYEQMTLLPRA